jgi:hypothetical protein
VVGVTVVGFGVGVVAGVAVVTGVIEAVFTCGRTVAPPLSLELVAEPVGTVVVLVVEVVVVLPPPAGGVEAGGERAFAPDPFWRLVEAVPASRRCPASLGWSDAAAATRAKSDSETARTAHQCGRIRGPPAPTAPALLISPPTG